LPLKTLIGIVTRQWTIPSLERIAKICGIPTPSNEGGSGKALLLDVFRTELPKGPKGDFGTPDLEAASAPETPTALDEAVSNDMNCG
jgi:hypothetical protein